MSDEPIRDACPCGGFGGKDCRWVEVTPKGIVQVSCDGTVYLIDGVCVPPERYHDAIRTGIW